MTDIATTRIAAAREVAEEPLGVLARRIFAAQRRSRYRQVHSHMSKNLLVRFRMLNHLRRCYTFARRHAGVVTQQRGIPLSRQLAELLKLTLAYDVDPATYYAHHLYEKPAGIAEVDYYLGRNEMKNGLYDLLTLLRRDDPAYGLSLSEKAIFSEACRRGGLPVVPILAVVKHGAWSFTDAKSEALDCDLFVKTVRGKGASGARAYRFTGDGTYATKEGEVLSREGLLRAISAESASGKAMLVTRRLVNHPEIADLVGESLITFRVFTCLDAEGEPVVTHGMLRTLSKLEPRWQTDEEYAASLDIATGALRQMCGDADMAPDAWWDRHPKSGVQVRGRVIANWPAVAALAVAAHRVFCGRVVTGWDLALTPDGPVVIEGNSDADTHFLQRVHRQMIGRSPMAPLLRHHLLTAERVFLRDATSPSAP